MIQYEELQMNALPSLQTILYDGWVLRFAKGYTNRANSVNPIYEGTKDGSCKTTHTFDEIWFEYYCRFNHISENNAMIQREILMNLIPDTLYTLYYLEDQVIACGMAVVEDGYLGLFDITVSEEYRNLGYGAKLIGSMLSLGKECGAKTAYLQVMLNNPSAFHLYQKFGFTQMYQYHYRTTPK